MEGDTGEKEIEVRVRLEPASTLMVTVGYTMSGATETTSGTLTFQPGEVLKTITVKVVGNTTWEPDKKATITLHSPKNALLGTASAQVVIVNDDPPTRASLADLTLDEGNDAKRTLPITINFDRPTPPLAKIHVWTVNGMAVDGIDFIGGFQVLYPQQVSQITYNLEVMGDAEPECDKGFFIHYRSSGMGDDAEGIARVLLRNDDGLIADCPDPFSFLFLDGGVTPAPDGGATPVLDGGATAPVTGGAGDASAVTVAFDASAPAPRLSKGNGACALVPHPQSGPLPLVTLGLALAWLGSRRRRS